MAEIINLNRFRKTVRKAEAADQAAQNRVRYGRIKEEKQRDAALRRLEETKLDGNKQD